MNTVQKICLFLTIIGGINWGMIGLFNFNLVEAMFTADSFFTNLIYTLVGLASIINIGLFLMKFTPMKNTSE